MKYSRLIATILTTLLIGCTSTSEQAPSTPINVDSRFTDCNLPTLKERGPIRPSLFVVGTFPDGQWIHMEQRQMGYKGDGIYQAVTEEKAGNVSLQFATMAWTPQYTASGLSLTVGQVKQLKKAGFGKNTVIELPQDGKYDWTIQISSDKKPLLVMVNQCK